MRRTYSGACNPENDRGPRANVAGFVVVAGGDVTRLISTALVIALWGLLAPVAPAQPRSATLVVRVADDTGGVIVGAHVTVTPALPSAGSSAAPVSPPAAVAPAVGATGAVGTATFDALTAGFVDVRVESQGFEPTTIASHRLKPGTNRLEVRLAIEAVALSVDVARDAREKALDSRGDTFARVLGPEQIAQLPDDPEELERALTQMAGPGAIIRVNGFGGGRLPAKGQIRQIRFNLNSYSAERHDLGTPVIEIVTQPGGDAWRTSMTTAFRTRGLTARHAYSSAPPSDELYRGGMSIDGPVWKNRTSMSIAVDASSVSDLQTVMASTPAGAVSTSATRSTERTSFGILVEHALNAAHVARLEVARTRTGAENVGVGGTNLPDRAYGSDQRVTTVRVSDSGSIGRRVYNEFRVQNVWRTQHTTSATAHAAIVVLDAFAAGGAQADSARRSWELDLEDAIDVAHGRHGMRGGVLLQAGRYRASDRSNALGTFTFSNLESFVAGRPATFTRREGNPSVSFDFYRAGWYVQDEIRVHTSVTLGLGVRHEFQSQVSRRHNISPRLGMTWVPLANGKFTLRGGVGLVYEWFEPTIYEQTLRVDGQRQYDVVVTNPGYPDPMATDTWASHVLPRSRLQRAGDLRLPRVFHTSGSAMVQLRPTSRLVVTYTRQRGTDMFRGRNVNAPMADGARPDPRYGNVIQVESTGRSALDRIDSSVSHVVVRNMRMRLMATASYSLAWSRNDADSPFSLPADSRRPDAEWGPAVGDIRHRATAFVSGTVWRGLRVTLMGGVASAAPYTITTGYDSNGDSTINDRPPGVGRNSGRGSWSVETIARLGYSIGVGKRTSPSAPRTPDLRRLSREAERDPMGVIAGATGGGTSDRLRLECFVQVHNVPNYTNRIGYRGVMTSPYFGQATAALPPRRAELGVRLEF